jgi:hypothetical protein
MIKSRSLIWAGHVARMGKNGNPYRNLVGNPEEKRPLRNLRGWWKIILKWIFEK